MPSLGERISAIFLEELHIMVPPTETDLLEAGILDSLQLVELLFHIEKEFSIRIPLESIELDSFRSISSIASLIEKQQR